MQPDHCQLSRPCFAFIFISVFLAFGCGGDAFSPQRTEAESVPVKTPTPPAAANIKIAAVGDIMLGSPFPDDTRMPPKDGTELLKEVTPLLSSADITFGNMEAPMIDDGISEKCPKPKPVEPKPPEPKSVEPLPAETIPDKPEESKPKEPIRCFAFRMPTRYAAHLKTAGFDVVSLANNHSADFGMAGLSSSRQALDSAGIKHAGSDRARYAVTTLKVVDKKVTLIAFAHNKVAPNVNELASAAALVAKASKISDIVVVSFHGGAEGIAYQRVPRATEVYAGEKRGNLPLFARTVIDAGADLVLGHGPHVLRGMEIYKGRLIAYSLGNFATYGWFRLENELSVTMVLEIELSPDGKFAGGKIHSVRQQGRGVPVPDPTGAALAKVKMLSNADFPATAPKFEDDGSILPR